VWWIMGRGETKVGGSTEERGSEEGKARCR